MKRTLSIGSRVPPAVTSTRSPLHSLRSAGPLAGESPAGDSASQKRHAPRARGGHRLSEAPHTRRAAAAARPDARRPARRAKPGDRHRARRCAPRGRAAARYWPVSPRARTCGCSSPARAPRDMWRRARNWSAGCRRGRPRALPACSPKRARSSRGRRLRPARRWLSGWWAGSSWPGKAPRAGSCSNSSVSTGAPVSAAKDASPTKR